MASVSQLNCLFHPLVQKELKFKSKFHQKLPFRLANNF